MASVTEQERLDLSIRRIRCQNRHRMIGWPFQGPLLNEFGDQSLDIVATIYRKSGLPLPGRESCWREVGERFADDFDQRPFQFCGIIFYGCAALLIERIH